MFEPSPDWYEALPVEPARQRLERAEAPVWPDIPDAELVGWGWSLLVSDREEKIYELSRDVPGFSWSAVGLLDPEVDPRLESRDPRFGVILYADDPRGESGARLENLPFDAVELPVVVRNVRIEPQGGPSSIGPGRVACWATSRGGERQGWLTARHVAEHSGLPGEVIDRGRFCIDAALVNLGTPAMGQPRRSVPPTPHSAIELDFGEPVRARVLDVGTNCGIVDSSYFPLRFTVNQVGEAGDSGGLVLADPCREPMGIYLGSCELENGNRAGFAQALNQLEYLMNLEAYL
jgi:hypothetical protein